MEADLLFAFDLTAMWRFTGMAVFLGKSLLKPQSSRA